jgi:serine/threonine protein phosphatase PrpC
VARTGADAIKLMGANCGDSRVLMIKDGQPPVQLTVDHVPDLESERQRIEDQKARNSKCVPERERERGAALRQLVVTPRASAHPAGRVSTLADPSDSRRGKLASPPPTRFAPQCVRNRVLRDRYLT